MAMRRKNAAVAALTAILALGRMAAESGALLPAAEAWGGPQYASIALNLTRAFGAYAGLGYNILVGDPLPGIAAGRLSSLAVNVGVRNR
jgi:hypothetical protein